MSKTLTPAETKNLTQKVNTELQPINKKIHAALPLRDLTTIFSDNDLDPDPIQQKLHDDEGRMHVQVGPEVWFTMTWYRFETGKFEVVAYVSSAHDDHRDPYTKVMNSSEKTAAKNKLNNKLLVPINKTYFKNTGLAFTAIKNAIAEVGFDWHEFEDSTTSGVSRGDKNNRLHVNIGNDIYMVVTWHKMDSSGNYEIVAYAS
jgi:hypothetical protein